MMANALAPNVGWVVNREERKDTKQPRLQIFDRTLMRGVAELVELRQVHSGYVLRV